jgi:hypothetical protein
MMPAKKLVKKSAEKLKRGDELEMIYGAAQIGAALNLNRRATYLHLEAGRIPGARKFGRIWAVSGAALRRALTREAPPIDA